MALGKGAVSGSPCRLQSLGPTRTLGAGCPLAERHSAAQRSQPGDTSPSPTDPVPSGPDKMEDAVSSRSHDGRRRCSSRDEARVDVRPPQIARGRLRPSPDPLARGYSCPLPRTGPPASRIWTGGPRGHRGSVPPRANAGNRRGGLDARARARATGPASVSRTAPTQGVP